MQQTRASKIERALEICAALKSVLWDLQPSHVKDIPEAEDDAIHARHLMDTLDAELQTLTLLRNAIIPAISRLPEDVLSYILSVPFREEDWLYKPKFSVTVSGVCASWRQTAINTPVLWSLIQIGRTTCNPLNDYGPPCHPYRPECIVDMNTEWCRRSKAVPMTIDYHLDPVYSPWDPDQNISGRGLDTLCEGLDAQSCRVGEIYCHLTRDVPAILGLTRLVASAKADLKMIEMTCEASGRPSEAELQKVFAVPLPRLEKIRFADTPLPQQPINIQACKELTLEFLIVDSVNNFLPLLQSCPAVERLKIARYFGYSWNDVPLSYSVEGTVLLHHLSYLDLLGDGDPASLLSSIMTPSLRTLAVDVSYRGEDPDRVDRAFIDFFQYSAAHLRSLSIQLAQQSLGVVLALRHAPELQYLILHVERGLCSFFEEMAARTIEGSFDLPCPRLTEIHVADRWGVQHSGGESWSEEMANALHQFVRRRREVGAVAQIKLVVLSSASYPAPETPNLLQVIAAEVGTLTAVFEGDKLVNIDGETVSEPSSITFEFPAPS